MLSDFTNRLVAPLQVFDSSELAQFHAASLCFQFPQIFWESIAVLPVYFTRKETSPLVQAEGFYHMEYMVGA